MSTFWKDKTVFVTGHTGFKGAWLCSWLSIRGAKVYGYSLPPTSSIDLYNLLFGVNELAGEFSEIRDFSALKSSLQQFSPEVIFHLAAQPLVRQSYRDPIDTFSTNIIGTVNLLEAVRGIESVKAIVNVTTDKCYKNNEWHWGYREVEPMGGHDPYSASKACSELITSSYISSYFGMSGIGLASARAGNVIGGGDWAEDRLIPDLIRGLNSNTKVQIRNPSSIRPWQHVLEPLSGYLTLAEKLFNEPEKFSGPWNFGPMDFDAKTVEWVADKVCQEWSEDAKWYRDHDNHPHEAKYLKLDISKAKALLEWEPRWSAEIAVQKTVDWYRAYFNGDDIIKTTHSQLEEYTM